MAGDLGDILKKPQGFVRLLLSMVLVLGAIGSTPGLKLSAMAFSWRTTVDLAVAGGALVALTLLLAGDSPAAALGFSLAYTLLSFAASILVIVYMADHEHYDSVGLYLLAVALVASFVLWIIEFALDIKDNFC